MDDVLFSAKMPMPFMDFIAIMRDTSKGCLKAYTDWMLSEKESGIIEMNKCHATVKLSQLIRVQLFVWMLRNLIVSIYLL